jgi:hypothetical protein
LRDLEALGIEVMVLDRSAARVSSGPDEGRAA